MLIISAHFFKRKEMNYIKLSLLYCCMLVLSACAANSNLITQVPVEKNTLIVKVAKVSNIKARDDAFNELDMALDMPAAVKTIVGTGYGATVDEARRDALNNLAGSVQVDVLKEVNTCKNQQGDCGSVIKVNTRSELPILGAKYQRMPNEQGAIHFQVWIDSQSSLPLYTRELDQLNSKIKNHSRVLNKVSNDQQRYRLMSDIVNMTQQYEKKLLVANILGGYKNKARAQVDINNLRTQLQQLERKASTLSFAAKVLTKDISVGDIYLHPPRPKGVQEVTPFASMIKENMSPLLQTVSLPNKAKYSMEGEYTLLDDGDIYLTYHLIDLNYRVIASHSVIVEKSAHKRFRSKPISMSFEALLHNDIALSNDFRAELKTLQGTETLYYKVGESLKLLVRLNRAGYYYIIGHVMREGEQFSYLLDLNDAEGNNRFIRYIPQDQVNKYIEVAEFEVMPPYGAEHLQLIASSKKITRLPAYQYRPRDGYYMLKGSEGNVMAGVNLTRGLRIKQNKNNVLTSEATLTYTTRPIN